LQNLSITLLKQASKPSTKKFDMIILLYHPGNCKTSKMKHTSFQSPKLKKQQQLSPSIKFFLKQYLCLINITSLQFTISFSGYMSINITIETSIKSILQEIRHDYSAISSKKLQKVYYKNTLVSNLLNEKKTTAIISLR